MTFTVEFRPSALIEFNESVDWYELRQFGLGEQFIASIDDCIELILSAPLRPACVYKGVRLQSVKGFPYQIYYRVVGVDLVQILSVFHVRQNPEIWRSRS